LEAGRRSHGGETLTGLALEPHFGHLDELTTAILHLMHQFRQFFPRTSSML